MGMDDEMRRFYAAQNPRPPRPPDPRMEAIAEEAAEILHRLLESGEIEKPRNTQVLARRVAMERRADEAREAAKVDPRPRRECVRLR